MQLLQCCTAAAVPTQSRQPGGHLRPVLLLLNLLQLLLQMLLSLLQHLLLQ